MEGQRQLHDAQVRAQVASGCGHRVDDESADFGGQDGQLLRSEGAEVGWTVDVFEDHEGGAAFAVRLPAHRRRTMAGATTPRAAASVGDDAGPGYGRAWLPGNGARDWRSTFLLR